MAHNIVCKIKEQAFQNGEKYHVGMKRYEEEITWIEGKQPKFEFFNDGKYDGVRIIVE